MDKIQTTINMIIESNFFKKNDIFSSKLNGRGDLAMIFYFEKG
jgi:hypothetical protein